MLFVDLFQIMAAVLFANGLTLWFGYGAWTVSKIERNGGKRESAPWPALLGLIIPPILAGIGVWISKV